MRKLVRIGIFKREDSDLASLDISDVVTDESLLSSEFQEIEELDLGDLDDIDLDDEEPETSIEEEEESEETKNLLKNAKSLLKKVKLKSSSEEGSDKLVKAPTTLEMSPEEVDVRIKLNKQTNVTELMVEELQNLGLNVKVIQDLINESKEYRRKKDLESAETLIKNSQIFASNLWLEHRMKLLSNMVSFINSFILNQNNLEMDLKTAIKYYNQAKDFLADRDITFTNKYLENSIQNIKKSWNETRVTKLKEASKYSKYWLLQLKNFNLRTDKLITLVATASDALEDNDLDRAEYHFRSFVDLSISKINTLNLEVNQKEDVIQGVQSVYDEENFSTFNEAITKAEAMLFESQQMDRIQLHLNLLLSAAKTVIDLENKGLEVSKVKELFSNAKELFDNEDYESANSMVKRIMGQARQMMGPIEHISAQKSDEKVSGKKLIIKSVKKESSTDIGGNLDISPDKMTSEQKEIYNSLKTQKKEIDYIKSIQKTGEDIVKVDDLFNKADSAFKDDALKDAKLYLKETIKVIEDLKDIVLRKKAEESIESTSDIIVEAYKLGVKATEAERVLKHAKEHLQNQEFKAAINDAVQSQQIIEMLREKHQNAADKILKVKLNLDKTFKDKEVPPELNELCEKAEDALKKNNYGILDLNLDIVLEQIEHLKSGESIDTSLLTSLKETSQTLYEVKDSINELRTFGINTTKVDGLLEEAKSVFIKRRFNDAIDISKNAEGIISESRKGYILNKLKIDAEKAKQELEQLSQKGADTSSTDSLLNELYQAMDNNNLMKASEILDNIYNQIPKLTKNTSEFQATVIGDLIEKLIGDISVAKQDKIQTQEAESILEQAHQNFKNKDYKNAIELIKQSRITLEEAKQTSLVDTFEDEKASVENVSEELEMASDLEIKPGSDSELEMDLGDTEDITSDSELEMDLGDTEDITSDSIDETSKDLSSMEDVDLDNAEQNSIDNGLDDHPLDDSLDLDLNLDLDEDQSLELNGKNLQEPNLEEMVEASSIGNGIKAADSAIKSEKRIKKKANRRHDGNQAERLFKEAFGFIQKDRIAIYDREPKKAEHDPGRDVIQEDISNKELDSELPSPQKQDSTLVEDIDEESIEGSEEHLDRIASGEKSMGNETERYRPEYNPRKPRGEITKDYGPVIDRYSGNDRQEAYYDDFRLYPPSGEPQRGTRQDSAMTRESSGRPGRGESYPRKPTGRGRMPGRGQQLPRSGVPSQRYHPYEDGYVYNSNGRGFDIDPRFVETEFESPEPPIRGNRGQPVGRAGTAREKRLESLKKDALLGLQEIQATISNSLHLGLDISELEQISEDARNAFEDGDFQEVLLYVDKTEEISRRLKIANMDRMVLQIQRTGENTEYLEFLIHEAEAAYNEDRFKVGDEISGRFHSIVKELEYEANTPQRSKVYCRHCGSSLPGDSSFCTVCGEKLW
jgi:hypothetical protein